MEIDTNEEREREQKSQKEREREREGQRQGKKQIEMRLYERKANCTDYNELQTEKKIRDSIFT